MIRDKGPTYQLGFGIDPSMIPTGNKDKDIEGPDPNSGFIAKALNGHPVMRFLAAGAATMVGIHVAGKVMEGTGIRLGQSLTQRVERDFEAGVAKSWQTTLLHNFRSLQKTLDEWEGLEREVDATGRTVRTTQRAGFWTNYAEHERAAEALAAGKGGKAAERPADWLLRDSVQQAMVRQMRRLPYELPAAYATQRVLTDRIMGVRQEDKPKWYNPVDVIGDFAQQSLRNVATLLLPQEVGKASLSHGFNRFMTYGDEAFETINRAQGPVYPHMPRRLQDRIKKMPLRDYSVSLNAVMNLVGHDVSDLLYKTMQFTNRSTGSFGTAISEGVARDKSQIEKLARVRSSYTKLRDGGQGPSAATWALMKDMGDTGLFGAVFPKGHGFFQSYFKSWDERGEALKNIEAINLGQKTYQWKGEALKVNYAMRGSSQSDIEKYAESLTDLSGNATATGVMRGRYGRERLKEAYRDHLEEQLIAAGIPHDVAIKFTNSAGILGIPRPTDREIDSRLLKRINFGKDLKHHDYTEEAYTAELQRRIAAVVPHHAEAITKVLPGAVQRADAIFTDPTRYASLSSRIQSDWKRDYQRIVLPHIHASLSESKVPYERFTGSLSAGDKEWLVRKTAHQMGMAVTQADGHYVSTDTLAAGLRKHGFNPSDHYQMKGFLLQHGKIAKPWAMGGFNILGLRPLTLETALGRGHFGPTHIEQIKRMVTDLGTVEPFVGGAGNRLVGRGAWETKSGRILDLTPVRAGGRKFLNMVSTHLQVPMIHLQPLDTAFYNVQRKLAQRPILHFEAGRSGASRFMSANAQRTEGLFWMKTKGASGRVMGFVPGEETPNDFGTYKVSPTDDSSMLGRLNRLAIRDKGRFVPPHEGPETSRQRWARRMSLDPDQPTSIIDWFRRGKGRAEDVRNPAVLSQRIAEGNWTIGLDEAKGFENLRNKLRGFGISPKVARATIEADPELAAVFSAKDPATGKSVNLADVRDPEQMVRMAKAALASSDTEINRLMGSQAPGSFERAQQLRRAQATIRTRYIRNAEVEDFSASSAKALRTTGIHTRLDEFRADFYRYLATSGDLQSGENVINNLLGRLDQLKEANYIGGGEYIEARAAVLSMQMQLYSVTGYDQGLSTLGLYSNISRSLANNPQAAQTLGMLGRYEDEAVREGFPRGNITRRMSRRFGRSRYEFRGVSYNPFGQDVDHAFVPTIGTAAKNTSVFRAAKSAAGIGTWNDPEAYSTSSVLVAHGLQRLNKFFGQLGVGVNEANFKGPWDFLGRGLIGKRILPAVIGGTTVMAVDRTLGGRVYKDQNGKPIYRPLVGGALASVYDRSKMIGAGVVGGRAGYQQEKEKLQSGEVPVRQGRYWLISPRTPWRGGRTEYFRPPWERRLKSGYLYTPQTYGTPLERLAYDYDFSPLRLADPYHFERKHYNDRPYPVTGGYFTGPMGPLSGALNLTVGHALKPSIRMHKEEMRQVMSGGYYQRVGQSGMAPIQYGSAEQPVAMRSPAGYANVQASTTAGKVLHVNYNTMVGSSIGGEGFTEYGVAGVGPASRKSRGDIGKINAGYIVAAGNVTGKTTSGLAPSGGGYNQRVLVPTEGTAPRLVPAMTPLSGGSRRYQASELGFQTQEMFGIYGFAFASVRHALGFGRQDLSPQRPVLANASQAYGLQRRLWDLNLGGAGDFPNPSEGEYGNIEFGEVGRRFLPHPRNDVNWVNPLQNQLGHQYPWLPASDYFLNFHQGDPFAAIPEGEMRLPGPGYERTHTLHPDTFGRYGILDQFSILSDVAPWSNEFRTVSKMVDAMDLSPEQRQFIWQKRQQAADVNKRHDFYPELSKANFKQVRTKVVGFQPGEADVLNTTIGPVRFAGAGVRNPKLAMQYAQQMVKPGAMATVTYDLNTPPNVGEPLSGIVNVGGNNINQQLLASDYGFNQVQNSAIDAAVMRGTGHGLAGKIAERISHGDTFFNEKFLPHRTALEDWERHYVYGTDFPQWQHPVQDFLKPMFYKAAGRNPLFAAGALAGVGSLFGRTPESKTALKILGAGAGLGMSTITNADSLNKGQRFIPIDREKQMAVNEYCLSADTQALTNNGWKYYWEIDNEDQILSLDIETGLIDWQEIQAITTYDWHDELIHWDTPHMDAMMTPNHGWIIKHPLTGRLSMKKAKDLHPSDVVVLGYGTPNCFSKNPLYEDEFVELIGWVVMEGNFNTNGSGVTIAQKATSPHIERLYKLKTHFDLSEYKNHEFLSFYCKKPLGRIVRECVTSEKTFTSEFLTSLTKSQTELLYNTCIAADGWQNGNSDCFGQNQGARVDAFQFLCAMLGLRTVQYPRYDDADFVNIGIKKYKDRFFELRRQIEYVETASYEGVVWCPTTSKGTWFARRNGKTYWTGNTDILNYVKYNRLYDQARQQAITTEGVDPAKLNLGPNSFNRIGPSTAAALEFQRDLRQTMYGADLFGDISDEAASIPSQKREHFQAFLQAPLEERPAILSTAPRLERRMYEARWGMRVEQRPKLEQYFQEHELPPDNWEGWSPSVPADAIKVKIAQSMGLDVSQMGYYPQQTQEANLINVSYPDYNRSSSRRASATRLRQLMARNGVSGTVATVPNSTGKIATLLNAIF